jgi:hypothetical protein
MATIEAPTRAGNLTCARNLLCACFLNQDSLGTPQATGIEPLTRREGEPTNNGLQFRVSPSPIALDFLLPLF